MNVVRGAVDAVLGRGDRQPMREADFHSDTYASNLLGLDIDGEWDDNGRKRGLQSASCLRYALIITKYDCCGNSTRWYHHV